MIYSCHVLISESRVFIFLIIQREMKNSVRTFRIWQLQVRYLKGKRWWVNMFIILIDLKCFSNTIHMFIAIYKNLQKIIAPPPIKKDQKKKNNNSKKKTGRRNTKQKPKQNKIPKTVVAMINENMRLFSKILNYLSFHLKEITQI